jgi:hypothetical protein
MTPQDELRVMYTQAFDNLRQELRNVDTTGLSSPHLIDLSTLEYQGARTKLLIVGQQTAGWGPYWSDLEKDSEGDPIPYLLECYRTFALGEQQGRRKKSPFWCAARQLYCNLNPDGPTGGFIWSNLTKMDHDEECPRWPMEERIRKAFNVLPFEIRIVRPAVVVFFSGPHYDETIEAVFGITRPWQEISRFSTNELARIRDSKGLLPFHSYRTYHPNFFSRSGSNERLSAVLEQIVAMVGAT